MDIVFLGTAPYGFPVMEDLALRDDTTVKGVITQPDRERGRGRESQSPPVANHARDLGLPLYQPEDINEKGLVLFDDLGTVDLAVVIAYGQILSEDLLATVNFPFYNFHASLLPRWRGAAPIRHTLLAGDESTGVTVFRIEPDLDTGPVCVQLQTEIRDRENYGSLYERLSQVNVGALRVLLSDREANRLHCRPQEGDSTYAPKISSGDPQISWDRPAAELERFVRAFSPDPGAFTERNGERFKIYDARAIPAEASDGRPGEVLRAGNGELVVVTGEGCLRLESVQPAGSRRMDVESYLAGNPDVEPGTSFE
jgi:methionyl-tRNA formyltransferase